MSGDAPPEVARRLAALAAARDDRALVLADLEERYRVIARERGVASARRWYWSQALRGLVLRPVPDADRVRRLAWSGVLGDLRHHVRLLARRPLYTAGVAGTLAIGLTSAAVVGSLAWHVWLAPMPFPDPEGVVRLFELEPPDADAGPSATPTRWRLSPPLLEDLRAQPWQTVEAVAGVARGVADWERDGQVTRTSLLTVSTEFFAIAGVSPLAGRLLSDDPDAPEVLLTAGTWAREYGSDQGVFGGSFVVFDGRPLEIVGVVDLPDAYPGDADFIASLVWTEEQLGTGMRGARYLDVIARVAPGYGVAEVAAEMGRKVSDAGRQHANHDGWGGDAAVLGDELLRPYRPVLVLLMAAGAAFLLLAIVNVSGLVAARTVEDRAERGIRLALGASAWRLLRGSLLEGALVAVLSVGVALAAARWLVEPVKSVAPAEVPRITAVALDAPLVLVTVAAALAIGLAIGMLAHLLGRSTPPVSARRTMGGSERLTGRNAIVVAQVALTVLLLTTGGAILRTVNGLQAVELGFDPEGVSSTQVMLTGSRYSADETRAATWRALLEEGRSRGLEIAMMTNAPMAGVNMPWGHRVDPTEDQAFAQYRIVSPGAFSLLGVELLEGRVLDEGDTEESTVVVVINDVLAHEGFGDASPVGRTIEVIGVEKTIVGVVRGTRHFGPDQDVPREIFVPFTQDPWPHAQLLVRGEPASVRPAIASAADAVDPSLGLAPAEPYDRFVSAWYAGLELQLLVVGVLAGVGLLLATLGLYALVAYRVTTRRREIGVRMALGASARTVFREIVRHGVVVASLGLVLGLLVWYGATPWAARWAGEVSLDDPWTPILVALFLAGTSALAAAIPARRSIGLDPSATLRDS